MLGAFAVSLRFIPYSDHHGHLHLGWSIVVGAMGLVVAAASVYLVYVLEILKLRRLSAIRIRRVRPDVSQTEVDADVARQMETGEFEAVKPGS
jgi:UDP-GlcNAc:undecaprenyl-phosphate GlcNAc-1-phosphate transferase